MCGVGSFCKFLVSSALRPFFDLPKYMTNHKEALLL